MGGDAPDAAAQDAPGPVGGPAIEPVATPDAPGSVLDQRVVSEGPADAGEGSREMKVKLILEDGTMASPGLDPESEERLRYILDNIVPPSDGPAT